ncbi:hypothetical protein HanPI659440_Chr14g0540491 [Helianthus annuus]|nr:hypothetical protein HanPI659440_Chr14g0540491 [Helianthus annuus]
MEGDQTDERIDETAILIATKRVVLKERSSSATSAVESKKEGLFSSFVLPLDTSFKSEIKKKQDENITSIQEDGDPKKKVKAHTNEKKCTHFNGKISHEVTFFIISIGSDSQLNRPIRSSQNPNPVLKTRMASALHSLGDISQSADRLDMRKFRKNLNQFLVDVRV